MTNTYLPIATTTLASPASEINFAGLPQNYGDLAISINGVYQNSSNQAFITFNGDTGLNYFQVLHLATFTTSTGNVSIRDRIVATTGAVFENDRFTINLDVINYSSTNTHKGVLHRYGAENQTNMAFTRYASLSSIGTVTVGATNGFAAGTTVSIYGVAK